MFVVVYVHIGTIEFLPPFAIDGRRVCGCMRFGELAAASDPVHYLRSADVRRIDVAVYIDLKTTCSSITPEPSYDPGMIGQLLQAQTIVGGENPYCRRYAPGVFPGVG